MSLPDRPGWSPRWMLPTSGDALLYGPLLLGLLVPCLLAPGLAPGAARQALFLLAVVIPIGERLVAHALRDVAPGLRQGLAPVVGTAFVVALEGVVARLGRPGLGVVLWPLALAAIVHRCRAGSRPDEAPPDEARRGLAVVSSVVVLMMLVFAVLPTLPPTATRASLVYQDTVWTAGNTESVAHWGLPVHDLRVDGSTFGYHAGQNLLGAARMAAVGGTALEATVSFDPVCMGWMLAVTLVSAAVVWLAMSARAAVLLAVIFCLTDSLAGGVQANTYPSPISYAFSLAPLVAVSALVLGHLRGHRTAAPGLVFLLYLAAASGKLTLLGIWPIACLVGLTMSCVLARRVPARVEWWVAAATVLATVVAAALLLGPGGADGPGPWPPLPNARVTRLLEDRLHLPFLVPVAHAVGRFVRDLIGLVSWLPVGLLVVTAVATSAARGRTWRDPGVGFLVGFVVTSLGLNAAIFFRGGNTYFLLYAEMITLLALADRLEAVRGAAWGRAAMAVSLVVGLGCFALWKRDFLRTWARPLWSSDKVWDERAGVDRGEWDACRWLRDHTPPEARFVDNRHLFRHEQLGDEASRVFWCTALSGRQAWLEGTNFTPQALWPEWERRHQAVDRLFAAAPDERDRLLGELTSRTHTPPIRYVVQSVRFGQAPLPESPHLALRYQNPSARVYEVIDGP